MNNKNTSSAVKKSVSNISFNRLKYFEVKIMLFPLVYARVKYIHSICVIIIRSGINNDVMNTY
jgi:hypothetical protein